ncbi:MAG: PAS domain S-box protein [Breznakibacter sp.]
MIPLLNNFLSEDALNGFIDKLPLVLTSALGTLLLALLFSSIQKWLKANRGKINGNNGEICSNNAFQCKKRLGNVEQKHHVILNSLPDIVFIIDKKSKIQFINQTVFQILGFHAEEMVGKSFFNYVAVSETTPTFSKISKIFRERKRNTFTSYMYHRSGRSVDVEITASVISYDGKEVVQGNIRDISDKKKHDIQIKTLLEATEQSYASIVITNTHGEIEYVNQRFTEVTGYSYKEAIGKNPRILKAGTMPKQHYEKLWETITAGERWQGDFINKKKDGSIYIEKASISPVFDEYHTITHFVAVKEDITKQKLAEKALKESEEKYRIITNSTVDIIFAVDQHGNLLYCNERLKVMLGHEIDEILNQSFHTLIPQNDLLSFCRHQKKVWAGKEANGFVTRLIHKDGQLIDVEISGKLTRYNGKQVILGVIRDISERKHAEEKLRLYKKIFDNSLDGVAIISKSGRYIEQNNIHKVLIGDSNLNVNEIQYAANEEINTFAAWVNEIQTNGFYRKEVRLDSVHGPKDLDISVFPIFNENGALQCYISMKRDISERKRIERELAQRERSLKTIVGALPDLVFHMDEKGRFLSFYQGSNLNALWVPPQSFLNKSIYDFFSPEFSDNALLAITETLVNGEFDFEYTIQRKGEQHFHAKLAKLNDNEVIAVVRDITKLKETELKLKELISTKDKILAIIAHDLKNPFHGILGFTDIMLASVNEFNPETFSNYLRIVNSQVENALELLQNLLNWAMTQSDQIVYREEKVSLKKLIEEVMVLVKSSATVKDVNIRLKQSHDIELNTDSNMLKTILRNLTSNAIKFTCSGGQINIEVETANDFVNISVEDSGVGIPQEMIDQLFSSQLPVTTSGTADEKGSGLGLVLCKEFIHKLGGRISVQSKVGSGSRFAVILPRHRVCVN